MSTRIGLYIGMDRLACVVLTRNRVVWHSARERSVDLPLSADLDDMLGELRPGRLARPALFATLGPALAQVKQLRGLPPVESPRVLKQLIEGSPSRFFLAAETTPIVATPMKTGGGWWAAVADAAAVSAIATLCARRSWRAGGTSPLAMVLKEALAPEVEAESITWRDGDADIKAHYAKRQLISISRTRRVSDSALESHAELAPALMGLGNQAWQHAGAYAAARAGAAAPLQLHQRREDEANPRHVVRRGLTVAAVLVGLVVILAAPGTVAARVRAQNEHIMEGLKSSAAAVARDRYATQQVDGALRQVRAFAATRRLVTPLLSSLSTQLPESTAIINLRVDTLGGTVVTLSPLGTAIVAAVGNTPDVDGLQLSAPITREQVGPIELQRMAVRFRFKRTGQRVQGRKP